jgi:hypothetical protein
MLERAKIADYLWKNTFSRMKATWLARKIMHALLPLIVWALGSVEPIPCTAAYRRRRSKP